MISPRVGLVLTMALACFPVGAQEISMDADAGVISAPFVVSNHCVYQPVSTAVTNGGKAEYSFKLPSPGTYAVQLLVNAPGNSGNTVAVAFDPVAEDPGTSWDVPPTSGFQPRFVGSSNPAKGRNGPSFFLLSAGAHKLILRGAGANVQVQRLLLFKRPAPPQSPRIVAGQ